MKKLFILVMAGMVLLQGACSDSRGPSDATRITTGTAVVVGSAVLYLSSIWQKVTVADVPGFSFTNKDGLPLRPGCACPPALEGTTGQTVSYSPEFAFFVKPGSTKNLLIYFQGGGACWDITNCAYNHTYSPGIIESTLLLGLGVLGFLESFGGGGIMDMTDPQNPFLNWTVVYIPYCTGDLGAGQQDYVYADDYGTAYTNVTIRHRGLANVNLVLEWMRRNITFTPDKLFVTGISAGSYAAMLSYPLIRDLFNSASTKAYMLGDAGEGVTGEYDPDGAGGAAPIPFMQIVENIWDLQLPAAVFGSNPLSTYSYKYKNLVQEIVTHYPNDRFAQYTAKWDKTQVWFYYIQSGDAINKPDEWGAEESAPTFSAYSTAWNSGMMDAIDITGGNYTYFIGPGTKHTILLFPEYYTVESGGVLFSDWVNDFINGATMPDKQDCAACPAP